MPAAIEASTEMQMKNILNTRAARKLLAVLLLGIPAALVACGGNGRLTHGITPQVEPVAVESIVSVEKRPLLSGTTELVIPEAAVFHRGPLAGVYVVDGEGRAVIRWIDMGRSANGDVVVLGGLDAGERIVGNSSVQLEDGMPVKLQVSESKEAVPHE